jgi:hypothetical protein
MRIIETSENIRLFAGYEYVFLVFAALDGSWSLVHRYSHVHLTRKFNSIEEPGERGRCFLLASRDDSSTYSTSMRR